jgi:hypothetical protein
VSAGPGKYDEVCKVARELAGAETTIVIVLHGALGSGFSVQSVDPQVGAKLPALLRNVAEEIEHSEVQEKHDPG